MTEAPVAILLLGAALLLFGRRLFWLFIGAAGFAAGLEAEMHLFQAHQEQPGWVTLLVALLLGMIGILLAIFLQKLAISIGGFVGGAYLTLFFLHGVGEWNSHVPAPGLWLAVIVGGIVGTVLMLILFKWTLIVLSSVLGAVL